MIKDSGHFNRPKKDLVKILKKLKIKLIFLSEKILYLNQEFEYIKLRIERDKEILEIIKLMNKPVIIEGKVHYKTKLIEEQKAKLKFKKDLFNKLKKEIDMTQIEINALQALILDKEEETIAQIRRRFLDVFEWIFKEFKIEGIIKKDKIRHLYQEACNKINKIDIDFIPFWK